MADERRASFMTLEQIQAEHEGLQRRVARLEAVLFDVRDMALDRHDVKDGEDGPVPNDWMRVTTLVDEVMP